MACTSDRTFSSLLFSEILPFNISEILTCFVLVSLYVPLIGCFHLDGFGLVCTGQIETDFIFQTNVHHWLSNCPFYQL